jgi:hypothetical protein
MSAYPPIVLQNLNVFADGVLPGVPDNYVAANALAARFIIDLPDLGGAEKIKKLGVPVRTPVSFEEH